MSTNTAAAHTPSSGKGDHVEKAGAFDVRNFIAALIGLYGLVVLIAGLVSFTPEDAAKTGGVNANLWAGVVMLAFAAAFFAWAKVAPIKVEVHETEDGKELEAAD
ncbi:hypothetical protein [Mariniluteicoccus flavus]